MKRNTERVRQLLADIRQDLLHYDQLHGLLQRQYDGITRSDTRDGEQLRQQLMTIYQQLHLSAQRRSALLQALTLTPDDRGMKKLLPHLPPRIASQAEQAWAALATRARQCQQLNQRNGLLLTLQQETLRPLLPSPADEMFYHP